MLEEGFRTVYPMAAEMYAASGFQIEVVREHFGSRADWNVIARMLLGNEGDPPHAVPGETAAWYQTRPGQEYWPAHLALLFKKNWDEQAIQTVDIASTRVMQHLFDPSVSGRISRYGLVIGHVQSGKTANFTAVIAKAADSGYNFVVVLTGLYNDLRDQTQARLCTELMGTRKHPKGQHVSAAEFRRRWKLETDVGQDFHDRSHPNAPSPRVPTIAVMKKNVKPLERLHEWVDTFPVPLRESLNVLIVDDEADHASINTMTGEEVEDYKGDSERSPSRINVLLRQLIGKFSRVAYVGYTATPFANVFIDPEEADDGHGHTLYPRDFIVSLPKPPSHFGLEEVFGSDPDSSNQMDHVVIVPQGEADLLREMTDSDDLPSMDVPDSLTEALMDYLLAGAVRAVRGEETHHHTMMVHTKHTVLSMRPLVKRIRARVQHMKIELAATRSRQGRELCDKFRIRFAEQFSAKGCPEVWADVRRALLANLTRRVPDVREINMDSDDTLDFDVYRSVGLRSIAVGGNRLSRGLTLEGLCTSFFIRPTTTHDTLMQMSRWFGFRSQHQDLIRVHVTSDIAERFAGMAQVERELRDDLERYEQQSDLKPIDFGVRVLKQEGVHPTRAGARRNVGTLLAGGTEDRKIFFTGQFHFRQPDLLVENLRQAALLTSRLGAASRVGTSRQSLLWRNVPPEWVIEFLLVTHFPDQRTWPVDRILSHIASRRNVSADELSAWSVAVVGLSDGRRVNPLEPWGNRDLHLVLPQRTRLAQRDSVGTLPGAWDFVIDLEGSREAFMAPGKQTLSYNRMWERRPASTPLLLVYIVDKASSVRATRGRETTEPRTDLFGPGEDPVDLLGFALTFPEAPLTATERAAQREYWIRHRALPFPGL